MTVVEISNADTMKILHHAFKDDAFETITVVAEQDSFGIIGMDIGSSIAAQIRLNRNLTHSYDSPVNLSILTKDFRKCLGYSTSTFIPSDMPVKHIRLTIQSTHMEVVVASRVWSFRGKFPSVGGIGSLPQLPSFDEDPYLIVVGAKLAGLSSLAFKENKNIVLHIEPNKLTFSSQEKDQVFEISGNGRGTASTVVTPYALDVVSQVCELSSLESLKIGISWGGLTRFYYTFADGTLEYVAACSGEE